ncbi:preprotein translocase subunit SecG [Granulicatella sp. zg-ZJ]|uniref:preprotein translocase subunit SecG n=1 Tax=unclassified Granulicatella TaxID=2630493 RepID=UPI0013BF1254|nr:MULTISPECIES: preprotein translocase subunit SecG [unclassified Granulicatella]MBS4750283.1 preprotein translocase subunit SecG [Carnobacteriaceae bacterium zg-ZUI78]NEW62525.1 preprotein translocase subunit SecG [Granulicatella sp. zg-ZJ]NEW66578.1 preprotein translocase subunit SecG [Granulicatella sp. zg-84]QMI85779.1 preprotein translocase subunit SecG [Carnobacteriaceae bacterium zg-84]
MYSLLSVLLIILSIIIIIAVVMQPTKTNAANSLSGGAEELFVRRKARGFEAFMQRATFVLLSVFFIITFIMMYLTSKGL